MIVAALAVLGVGMMRRRWLSAVVVLGLLAVGLAGSATAAKNPGPPEVPAVQGTVKDQCTGLPVSGFTVSLVDPTPGAPTLPPPKLTTSGFVFQSVAANPDLVLHVTASNHVALGGGADPGVGVPISLRSGPVSVPAVQQQGPTQSPDGVQVFTGLRLAVLLEPSAGCATALRKATNPAFIEGKVLTYHYGVFGHFNTAESNFTVDAIPDPTSPGATNPPPAQIAKNGFKYRTLDCGAYTIAVSSPDAQRNMAGTVMHELGHDLSCPHGPPQSGDIAEDTVMVIVLPALDSNQPPVIDWTTASTYTTHAGTSVQLNAAAHDPDPADNSALTYQWSSTNGTCTFTTPTSLGTDVSCGVGNALITLTVTDPHAATATSSLVLLSLPPIA
jgi:hypothetical protein